MSSLLFSVPRPAAAAEGGAGEGLPKATAMTTVAARMSGEGTSRVIREGELLKQSGDWGMWQKRWYTLSRGGESESTPHRSFALEPRRARALDPGAAAPTPCLQWGPNNHHPTCAVT
jgi:hypothetical protein